MRSSIFSTGKNLIHAMRLLSLFHTLDMNLRNMSLTSDRFSKVLQSILPVFDINRLRSDQEMALYAFLTVKDVFVNLPTGSKKSTIYQLAPLLSLRLEELSPNSGLGKSDAIHVVVSPLNSLMFFAHSLHLNVPTRLNSNFKILLYSFQLLPTIVMFQKFPITF